MPGESTVDREALRERARQFLESEEFEAHYGRSHFAAWTWYLVNIIRCITVIGLPGGIRSLLATRNQVLASDRLRQAYRELPKTGRVVQGFLVMNNVALQGERPDCAPALVVASLAGTDEGDALADDLCGQIIERIDLGEGEGEADAEVARMLEDEEFRHFRKRPLPTDFTGGPEVHLLDVKLDPELFGGRSLFDSFAKYFLVDPRPDGLILQIPSEPPTDSGEPAGEETEE